MIKPKGFWQDVADWVALFTLSQLGAVVADALLPAVFQWLNYTFDMRLTTPITYSLLSFVAGIITSIPICGVFRLVQRKRLLFP